MSAIYGFEIRKQFFANSENQTESKTEIERYREVMTAWNRTYGTKEINEFLFPAENVEKNLPETDKNLMSIAWMGVRLEHFRKSIPVQEKMLKNESGWAVLDTLLFNREELIQILTENEGPDKIKTENIESNPEMSDEELLFQLILQKGIGILEKVNGDFSGVIYDNSRQEYLLFRDHLGIRPLFYYMLGDLFVFSTDERAILAFPGTEIHINEEELYAELTGAFRDKSDNTEFREIRYVKAASWLKVSYINGKYQMTESQTYWNLGAHPIRMKSRMEYQQTLRQLIERAIQCRMDAVDGPIGAELSGGLDSTVISILIHRLGRKGIYHSWSADPEIQPIIRKDDERLMIQEVCDREGFTCQFMPGHRYYMEDANVVMQRAYPPCSYTIHLSRVSKWASEHGTQVVMTGHGGDEGVSHRGSFFEPYYHKEYKECIRLLYQSTEGWNLRPLRTIKRFWRLQNEGKERKKPYQESDNIEAFLNRTFADRLKKTSHSCPLTFSYDVIDYIKKGGQRKRMDNTAFQAAYYGVRYLYPYLDHELINFAVSIPRSQYYNGKESRCIYRNAFSDILPKSIATLQVKETASKKNEKPNTVEAIQYQNADRQHTISLLDENLWKSYLDFDKLHSWKLDEQASAEEYRRFVYSGGRIFYCLMIQNVLQKTRGGQCPPFE